MIATTIRVVCNSLVSIEPKASNRSAKSPAGPVTWVVIPAEVNSFSISSLMNSIIFGKTGSPSTLASATAKSNWAFIRIAFPSADGIGVSGTPCAK